jgi:mRNA interferase MazF
MMPGMTLSPFELITVNFPFSDLTRSKQRPVVVLTPADRNGDFICLSVTSNQGHPDSILIDQADLKSGTLPKTSFARCDKIYTLHTSLIRYRVGALSDAKSQEIRTAYCTKLGCK